MNKTYTYLLVAIILVIGNLFFRGLVLPDDTWTRKSIAGPHPAVRCAREPIKDTARGFPFSFYGHYGSSGEPCGSGYFFNKYGLGLNVVSWTLIFYITYAIIRDRNKGKPSESIP